jgi:hypothetical protein
VFGGYHEGDAGAAAHTAAKTLPGGWFRTGLLCCAFGNPDEPIFAMLAAMILSTYDCSRFGRSLMIPSRCASTQPINCAASSDFPVARCKSAMPSIEKTTPIVFLPI